MQSRETFKKPLAELGLDDVRDLVDGSIGEPLLWEAKGADVRPEQIAKAACAFSNGVEPGYVLIGVEEDGTDWRFPGRAFGQVEASTWVSDIIQGSLRPLPRFAVVDFPGEQEGSRIAVIEIQPVSTPPCIANGTVLERLPGKSVRVSDPLRLAELYERGRAARVEARTAADRFASELVASFGDIEAAEGEPLRFSITLAATGKKMDVSGVIFTKDFETKIVEACGAHFGPKGPLPEVIRPGVRHQVTQTSQETELLDISALDGRRSWKLQARWDGSVGAAYLSESDFYDVSQITDYALRDSLKAIALVMDHAGGFGEMYLTVAIYGGRNLNGKLTGTVKRGPFDLDEIEPILDSVYRELCRITGQAVYED